MFEVKANTFKGCRWIPGRSIDGDIENLSKPKKYWRVSVGGIRKTRVDLVKQRLTNFKCLFLFQNLRQRAAFKKLRKTFKAILLQHGIDYNQVVNQLYR